MRKKTLFYLIILNNNNNNQALPVMFQWNHDMGADVASALTINVFSLGVYLRFRLILHGSSSIYFFSSKMRLMMGLSTSCKYGIPTAWQQNNTNNNTICPSHWHLCYRQATIRIIAERNGAQKTETRNSNLQSTEKRLWWNKGSQTHLHELLHCLGGKWIGTK